MMLKFLQIISQSSPFSLICLSSFSIALPPSQLCLLCSKRCKLIAPSSNQAPMHCNRSYQNQVAACLFQAPTLRVVLSSNFPKLFEEPPLLQTNTLSSAIPSITISPPFDSPQENEIYYSAIRKSAFSFYANSASHTKPLQAPNNELNTLSGIHQHNLTSHPTTIAISFSASIASFKPSKLQVINQTMANNTSLFSFSFKLHLSSNTIQAH